MKTYNDITVPPIIRTDRIISAFENGIDERKVEQYAEQMCIDGLCHEFPPIKGFPSIIDENQYNSYFMTGDDITEEHLGQLVWMVTDGHHRTLAAIKAELPHLPVEVDFNCITSEEDLKQYRNE